MVPTMCLKWKCDFCYMWPFAICFKEIMTLHGSVHLGLQPTNRTTPWDSLRPQLAPKVCLLYSNLLTDISLA